VPLMSSRPKPPLGRRDHRPSHRDHNRASEITNAAAPGALAALDGVGAQL
jgi:hypothetical protein